MLGSRFVVPSLFIFSKISHLALHFWYKYNSVRHFKLPNILWHKIFIWQLLDWQFLQIEVKKISYQIIVMNINSCTWNYKFHNFDTPVCTCICYFIWKVYVTTLEKFSSLSLSYAVSFKNLVCLEHLVK